MIILTLFRWLFSVSGIQFVDRHGYRLRLFGKTLFTFNIFPFLYYRPNGPTPAEIASWMKGGKVLKPYECRCGATVWAWRKVKVCGRFSCFRANGGKWR